MIARKPVDIRPANYPNEGLQQCSSTQSNDGSPMNRAVWVPMRAKQKMVQQLATILDMAWPNGVLRDGRRTIGVYLLPPRSHRLLVLSSCRKPRQ